MKNPLKPEPRAEAADSHLIVAWDADAANLGTRVISYLNQQLDAANSGEIDPADFFPLNGVAISDNQLQFPESKFYTYPGKSVVVLHTAAPNREWYKFLNQALNAGNGRQVKEVYTTGVMISLGAHTNPRQITGTFNTPEIKNSLSSYQLYGNLDYETPDGQRPTLNSFLLWTANRRNIPGVSLWVTVPFYLMTTRDPTAEKTVLEFLNDRFDLGLDFTALNNDIQQQNQVLARLREKSPEVDGTINKLESNLTLAEGESQDLVEAVEDALLNE